MMSFDGTIDHGQATHEIHSAIDFMKLHGNVFTAYHINTENDITVTS